MDTKSAFCMRELIRTMRDADIGVQAAFGRLEHELPVNLQQVAARLKQDLELDTADADRTWLRVTLRCLERMREQGVTPPAQLLVDVEAQHAANRAWSVSLAQAFVRTLFLSAATAAIAIVVAGVYVIFVLPQFAYLFHSMGAAMPRFTNALLGGGRILIFFALLALIVVAIFLLPLKLEWQHGERRWRFSPLAKRVWLGREVAQQFRRQLFVAHAAMLVAGGIGARKALAIASEEVGVHTDIRFETDSFDVPADELLNALAIAERRGHLDDEVVAQRAISTESLLHAVDALQLQVSFATRLLTYLLVGALVVAMYLPIFKVGAAV
jgi:type II secretory pathway component PulF